MQIEFLISRCKKADEILREAERAFNIILCRTESQFALNEECERMIRMIEEYNIPSLYGGCVCYIKEVEEEEGMLENEKEFFEGRTIKIKEEEWIVIKYFGYGLFLAVRSNDEFPKQAYLVREDNETIKGG